MSGDIGALQRSIYELLREISILKEHVASLERTVDRRIRDLTQVAQSIDNNISRTRLDISSRVLLLSTVVGLTSYVAVTSRLTALRDFANRLRERLGGAVELYRDRMFEVFRDYLSAVGDFFAHFTRRARLELDLMREILAAESVVTSMYGRLEPSYADPDIVKLVSEEDVAGRLKAVEVIASTLAEAKGLLEDASRLTENFRKIFESHEVSEISLGEDEVLLLPVLRVEAEIDGSKHSRTIPPCWDWDREEELSRRMSSYVAERLTSYPFRLTEEHVSGFKRLLEQLAGDEDERRLIREMVVEVM